MGAEKRQLGAILGLVSLIIITFMSQALVSYMGKFVWVTPFIIIVMQQVYAIPVFTKGFWKLFASNAPTSQEVYVPVMNEQVLYGKFAKSVNVLWIYMIVALVSVVSPILPMVLTDGVAVSSITFYMLLSIALAYIILCVFRGLGHITMRKELYAMHSKYFGKAPVLYEIYLSALCFVPLIRTITFMSDIQIIDKLTKFNNVEDLDMELTEDII